ncbi:Vacuolar protein sorting-associated protein 29 [Cichlidogyrus casuarinus]|uniref:Vacuolar protein sorting-associated protein 29 n=1 Tax=Cichlidogyrus casuarinus TaxID=1844966 RepID=A0ABD2Q7R1_9PLAT
MLVLVIGDFHIPSRCHSIHPTFRNLFETDRINHILCTGNMTSPSVENYLKKVCPDVLIVRGDLDENSNNPETRVLSVGKFMVGLTHGHQIIPYNDKESLAILQRHLDVDILIYGHTHELATYEYDGKFFINPGSPTGAYSSFCPKPTPSFVLLDIQDNTMILYIYRLHGNEHKVEKIEYHKPEVNASTIACNE